MLFDFVKEMPKQESMLRVDIASVIGPIFLTWVIVLLFPVSLSLCSIDCFSLGRKFLFLSKQLEHMMYCESLCYTSSTTSSFSISTETEDPSLCKLCLCGEGDFLMRFFKNKKGSFADEETRSI